MLMVFFMKLFSFRARPLIDGRIIGQINYTCTFTWVSLKISVTVELLKDHKIV